MPAQPELFVLMFRARKGDRWVAASEAGTLGECVAQIGSGGRRGGQWWLRRVDDTGLFAKAVDATPAIAAGGMGASDNAMSLAEAKRDEVATL